MRRGQPALGGWRNENPRHFRPRISGNSQFRPSRNYPLFDQTRFPPTSSRSSRQNIYPCRPKTNDLQSTEHTDYPRYKSNRYNSYQRHDRQPHNERQFASIFQQPTPHSEHHGNVFNEGHYYEGAHNKVDFYNTNIMGDIDHRLLQKRDNFQSGTISPWQNDIRKHLPTDRPPSTSNTHWHDTSDIHKIPSLEYSGHRPPASDHYGCNPTNPVSAIDKSNSFSRSVDDTVDIIRQRILSRSEPHTSDTYNTSCQASSDNNQRNAPVPGSFKNFVQEQPIKKRTPRQKQINSTNCAKIKNNIVHQLFKMDKEKIHKLMDNPSSSTKFEYAISSLITESQNSFNRHLRSVAEKSLCTGSSSDFIQDDNNTIYEDTFMKQMQCILDPQDTVLLEDIKPIVMAELSRALQLEDLDLRTTDDDVSYHQVGEPNYNQYSDDVVEYDNSLQNNNTLQPDNMRPVKNNTTDENYSSYEDIQQSHYDETKHLFKKRLTNQNFSEDPIGTSETSINDYHGHSNDKNRQQQLFDPTEPQLSDEEEDPFAELDKQYHVAVDHDFIEQDDVVGPTPVPDNVMMNLPIQKQNDLEITTPEKNLRNIQREVDSNFPNTISSMSKNRITNENSRVENKLSFQIKQELPVDLPMQANIPYMDTFKREKDESVPNDVSKDATKTNSSPIASKTLTDSSARKRSIDQRPSHRKEKRKKNDSTQPSDSSKNILNKNIIINVNDCVANKSSDKGDAVKSIFNLFFSKDKGVSKDKKNTSYDKTCSDKYVKRKEPPKTPDGKTDKPRKKLNSTSSSHSTSPKDTSSNISQIPSKPDSKPTLKPIDMFTEQPRKINVHQSHRNTALAPNLKINTESKTEPKDTNNKQENKRQEAVHVVRKRHNRESQTIERSTSSKFCQTQRKIFDTKVTQTDFVTPKKSGPKATDVFERMKEIDLEIQVLLQEKFRLYSSLESKGLCTNSSQTLGMTVLNVEPYEGDENNLTENLLSQDNNHSTEDLLSEDNIVNDFTSMPVEELQQIALESIAVADTHIVKKPKRKKRTVAKRNNKKLQPPNISLIEQIIIDDRPLEEIISLDDLEVKGKNTSKKLKSKRKTAIQTKVFKSYIESLNIKPCYVVLLREDFSKYINVNQWKLPDTGQLQIDNPLQANEILTEEQILEACDDTVEETVVNDIQFDMLDVSEDIVIGDSCEIKCVEDKEVIEEVPVPLNEEIILDNSQSSLDDAPAPIIEQSDECKVYDYSADENLVRDSVAVTGNADAVLAIECVENNFLAACLDGNVYYFNGDGQLLTTLRGSNLAVTCLTIVKERYGTTVYTGSLDSRIRYYDLETGLEKGPECNVLSPIQTMDRAWDTVFVGTRTGFVLQFECKNNMLIPVSTVKFSEQSILALRAMKEGPRKVLLVAARSENVTIKDAQSGLLLRTLIGPKMTVYTLLYEDGKVYCGTSSNQIHVFDYASGGHVGTHEGGKGAVCLRAEGGLVFAGCYDGCVYVFREGEARPLAQLRGPGLMLLSLAVVGTKIIAGYKDRSLYIWRIPLCILQEMIL